MESFNKSTATLYIILEFLLGIILSFIFLKFAWNKDNDEFGGKTIADGIIGLYGALSLIFFFSVFLVGIIGAFKLKRSTRIGRAIAYSILSWLLSLFISVFLAQLSAILSLYVILVGIVVGFNLGLGNNSQNKDMDSEISNSPLPEPGVQAAK